MSSILDEINRICGLSKLFRVGLSTRFKNHCRIELGGKGVNSSSEFYEVALSTLQSIVEEYIGKESLFIATVFDNYTSEPDKKDLSLVTHNNIDIEKSFEKESFYSDDDELYYFIFLNRCSFGDIETYIRGLIMRHISKKELHHNCEIFLIREDLKYCINLYDDRGVDIVSLD